MTGVSSAAAQRLDHNAGRLDWFCPLAVGDSGLTALTQMQCSASVTGAVDFVIGHALAIFPLLAADYRQHFSGINSALTYTRVFDDACLSFLRILGNAAAGTLRGTFRLIEG